ncbi:MAG: hypothetical protein RLY93_19785 [Sumerlaeia bacterium]
MPLLRSLVVIAFFAVMMTLLARDYLIPEFTDDGATAVSTDMLADQWFGQDDWYRIYLNGSPIGAMRTTTMNSPEEGFGAIMQLALQNGPVKGKLETATLLDDRLQLRQVSAAVQMPFLGQVTLAGAVTDNNNAIRLRLKSDEGVRYTELALGGPVTVPASMDPLFVGDAMVVGQTYKMDVYDPVFGNAAGRMTFEVAAIEDMRGEDGKYYRGLKRIDARMQNIETRYWVTDEGVVVQRQIRLVPANGNKKKDEVDDETDTGLGSFRITMKRLDPVMAAVEYADLRTLPELPDYELSELQGEDEGEPLGRFSLIGLLLKGKAESFGGAELIREIPSSASPEAP